MEADAMACERADRASSGSGLYKQGRCPGLSMGRRIGHAKTPFKTVIRAGGRASVERAVSVMWAKTARVDIGRTDCSLSPSVVVIEVERGPT